MYLRAAAILGKYLQLAAGGGTAKINDQFSKLFALLHVLEQSIDGGKIIDLSFKHSRNDRMDLLGLNEFNHILKLLTRAHRRATNINVLQDG